MSCNAVHVSGLDCTKAFCVCRKCFGASPTCDHIHLHEAELPDGRKVEWYRTKGNLWRKGFDEIVLAKPNEFKRRTDASEDVVSLHGDDDALGVHYRGAA